MLAGDSANLRKARGAFFTPARLARYVAEWAVRSADVGGLEPSCGEAVFLVAAGSRLAELRVASGSLFTGARLCGIELHQASAEYAAAHAAEHGHRAEVVVGDFLEQEPTPGFDAV